MIIHTLGWNLMAGMEGKHHIELHGYSYYTEEEMKKMYENESFE